MNRIIGIIMLGAFLMPLQAQAGLAGFINSCRSMEKLLNNEPISDLGDAGQALYCKGFSEGYYLGLLSSEKFKSSESCNSQYVHTDRIIRFLIAYYDEEKAKIKGAPLALFEAQPPEWFLEKSITLMCEYS